MLIRNEKPEDYRTVEELIKKMYNIKGKQNLLEVHRNVRNQ